MKQKGRPKKAESEKRNTDVTVSYNEREISTLNNRAALTKQRVAQYVREMSLRDEIIKVVSVSDQESARRVRSINALFNKLYINSRRNPVRPSGEKQINSNCEELLSFDRNDRLWSEINSQLRELNAQFLGYADDHQ